MLLLLLTVIVLGIGAPLLGAGRFEWRTKALAGDGAINCGRAPWMKSPASHIECAENALRDKRPFYVLFDHRGVDSQVAESIASDSTGKAFLLRYDSAPCGLPLVCLPSLREKSCAAPQIEALHIGQPTKDWDWWSTKVRCDL